MSDTTDKKAAGTGAALGAVVGGVSGGMAAGAAVGGMTGPVGAAVGAAVGAVAGALAGKIVKVDEAAEVTYWRDNYSNRPYVVTGSSYDDYGPAYLHGIDAYSRYPDRTFDEIEPELSRDWRTARGHSSLDWENAKPATRDAWQRLSDRVERPVPLDTDRDEC